MTFYFYDLETSGYNSRSQCIMQFGGQRTSLDLKPIGDPDNFLIKLTPDILPDPQAVLTHGITPQQTLSEGITEAEFLKYFSGEVAAPDTIFVGFNNIRFDDEFMRFTMWRNFTDAYEWQWKDGRSRWDLMDVVRMTRALRPEGIAWPKQPRNRLELIAKANKLEHTNAHDAVSDVNVLIDIARLLKTKQPKLFDYLLNMRLKEKAEPFVNSGKTFVYTTGKYPKELLHTSVAVMVAVNPSKGAALVYNLRTDPEPYLKMSPKELAEAWQLRGPDVPYFPVKELAYNKSPAVAPLSVLDADSQKRLELDMSLVKANLKKLQAAKDFTKKLVEALQVVEGTRQAKYGKDSEVDAQLYDSFVPDSDKTKMGVVRAAKPDELTELEFSDPRLNKLLPLYKARNFPSSLSDEEQAVWEAFRQERLLSGGDQSRAAKFFQEINELGQQKLEPNHQYLLEELNLYAQSILPIE